MKRALIVIAFLSLVGCSPTIKTAEYTFNQGTPVCQPVQSSLRGADPTSTGSGSTNSGGSGNTIIIIESTDQDSKADGDLSGAMDAVTDKLTGGLTDIPAIVEDIGSATSPSTEQGTVEVLE